MRRYGMRDDQWERIQDLLPGRVGYVGVTAKDNRLFVEAVLYRYRTGIPWRPGAICPSGSAVGSRCRPASAAGPRLACGSGCSSTWRPRPTTSTP